MESSSSKSAKTMFLVIYIPLALFIILSAILLVILHVCGISLNTSVTICEMKISMKWFYLLWFAFAVFIISAISALQYAKILCKRFKKRYVQIIDICLISQLNYFHYRLLSEIKAFHQASYQKTKIGKLFLTNFTESDAEKPIRTISCTKIQMS